MVVLPSPAGVGLMAVTRISLPSGLSALASLWFSLGLVVAVGDDVLALQAQLGGNFGDGLHFGGLGNFDVAQHCTIPPFFVKK